MLSDTTNQASITEAARVVGAKLKDGSLNLLINNAAVNIPGSLAETGEKQMMEVFQTNTVGPMLLTKVIREVLAANMWERRRVTWSLSKVTFQLKWFRTSLIYYPYFEDDNGWQKRECIHTVQAMKRAGKAWSNARSEQCKAEVN